MTADSSARHNTGRVLGQKPEGICICGVNDLLCANRTPWCVYCMAIGSFGCHRGHRCEGLQVHCSSFQSLCEESSDELVGP